MVDIDTGIGTRRNGFPFPRRVSRQGDAERAAATASPDLLELVPAVTSPAVTSPAVTSPPVDLPTLAPVSLQPAPPLVDAPPAETPTETPTETPAATRTGLGVVDETPTLPDLPLLPELLDIPELISQSDCNPLADRHVAVVGIHYAPEPTGVAPYTTAMAEHLATRSRLVTVLTGLPHYPTWRVPAAYRGFGRNPELHTPSLHLVRHGHLVPRRMTPWSTALYQASFALRTSRTRLSERPDLVMAVTPSPSSAIAGAKLAERYGCPLVMVVQDLVASRGRLAHDHGTGAMVSGRPTGMIARLEAAALRQADRVVVRSEAMVGAVIACGVAENRIDAVPVWPTLPPSGVSRAEARRRLGWARGRFTVVYCGDMGPAQGLDTVVDAAGELERRGVQVSFVLAGDGPHRRSLQHRVRSGGVTSVNVVDQVGPDDAGTMLAAADLLVLSERPGFGVGWLPGVVPSFVSAGRPIVGAVSPLGVVGRELVRSGAGRLVEPGQADRLADAIAELSRSQTQRQQLAAAAEGYAEQAYDRATAMREIETTVARVLAGI